MQKILDNDLFEMRKSKVTLTFNKPAYVGMCILDLSKVINTLFGFSNFWNKSKYYDNSNKLVVDKMEDGTETGVVAIKNLLDWTQICIHFW